MINELSQMCINGVDYELKDNVARQNMISVTDAKVGQTIKIAEVDSDGTPTKWEAANVSGGGCEVAVDGKALVFSNGEEAKNDVYELIDTLTVGVEGVKIISSTTDVNGIPYAFKAVFIKITTPAAGATISGYVQAFGDLDGGSAIKLASGYVSAATDNTNTRVTSFLAHPLYGLWFGFMLGNARNEGNNSGIYNYPMAQGIYSSMEYPTINKIVFRQSEDMIIGTTVEIWGVRA